MNTPLSRSLCSLRNADWGASGCHISALPWICCIWAPTPSVTLTANQLASQSGDSMSEKCKLVAWCLVVLKVYTPAVHWTALVCHYQGFILYNRPIRQGFNWYVGLKADWQEVDKITWMSPGQGLDFSVYLDNFTVLLTDAPSVLWSCGSCLFKSSYINLLFQTGPFIADKCC